MFCVQWTERHRGPWPTMWASVSTFVKRILTMSKSSFKTFSLKVDTDTCSASSCLGWASALDLRSTYCSGYHESTLISLIYSIYNLLLFYLCWFKLWFSNFFSGKPPCQKEGKAPDPPPHNFSSIIINYSDLSFKLQSIWVAAAGSVL